MNPFAAWHPAVAFAFFAGVIALSMAAMHPVYVALSCAGALGCLAAVRGGRAALRALAWAVPLVAVVAAANCLFVASGSTEIVRVGTRAVYVEALAYGLVAGGMLASVLLWFSSYAVCMGSEDTLALFGRALPTTTLMVSQVMRLVPQFVRRGRIVAAVQDAASAAAPATARERARGRLRVTSVLMGWGMEDGLIRSDAMRARGYDCGVRRTTYRRYRFGAVDAALAGTVVALVVANAALAFVACGQFRFYPALSALVPWWGYGAYALLLAVPIMLRAREWWLWRK
ncbi:energy-coupling factor transporter transmembrane component T [Gordonibacter sp. An230]|uniref:energy-coupling factor transporter transmembrane component T n=1 Tax=Gordonibacter sp. An230 TaxID=1965592 RepID=UPI000B37280D|nr:energy-coupling factor transporter transmembrane component T [Gordonibacter sp. An230]